MKNVNRTNFHLFISYKNKNYCNMQKHSCDFHRLEGSRNRLTVAIFKETIEHKITSKVHGRSHCAFWVKEKDGLSPILYNYELEKSNRGVNKKYINTTEFNGIRVGYRKEEARFRLPSIRGRSGVLHQNLEDLDRCTGKKNSREDECKYLSKNQNTGSLVKGSKDKMIKTKYRDIRRVQSRRK